MMLKKKKIGHIAVSECDFYSCKKDDFQMKNCDN